MIGVRIQNARLQAKLTHVMSITRKPRAIMAAAGRECGNQLKDHFRQKDRSEANRLGGRREHFWNKVAQSVSAPVIGPDGRQAIISITDPRFAQKLFGGVITAKRARNLSIPQTPEAYGRSPSTFERETGFKLILIKPKYGNAVLARAVEGSNSKTLQIEYVLKPSVNQAADPTALPDMDAVANAVADRVESVLKRQLKALEEDNED